MRVVGTAGHVDHGKSALVKALTGINPDRLREERERQMTIDLGFAWLTLPGGEEVGIIDVPGHRDFIENMLAGVGGIDAAILVIAADDGVMPQTREHLAILDLLDIGRMIVAITKIDLVEDASWLDLVADDVRQLLSATKYERAPIVFVSASERSGLDELLAALEELLQSAPTRIDRGKPRLPIDRVFSISGFGTVVTGTLIDGGLAVGQQVEILPKGLSARIRGLQTHKTKEERVDPGRRLAMNLSGVGVDELERGDVVCLPGTYRPTRWIDVSFRLLEDVARPLKHNQRVKLFIGSAQRIARVRVLGADEIGPGGEGWLQLVLGYPVVAARGDRFILRRPSPPATVGGGVVLDAHPARKHRRWDSAVLTKLKGLQSGSAEDILLGALGADAPRSVREIVEASGMTPQKALDALRALIRDGDVVGVLAEEVGEEDDSLVMSRAALRRWMGKVKAALASYHKDHPYRIGMPLGEFASRIETDSKSSKLILDLALESASVVDMHGYLRLPDFEVRLKPEQEERVERLMARFRRDPASPPSRKECLAAVGEDLLEYMIDHRILKQVSEDVLYESEQYEKMVARLREEMKARGTMTVAEIRDLFGTSRKYVLALMEHLDALGITRREGDVRRLL